MKHGCVGEPQERGGGAGVVLSITGSQAVPMAMTLEDAERVFGRPSARLKHKLSDTEREIVDWGYVGRGALESLPAWTPVAAAGVVGLLVGAALLWFSETQDYRVRAILKRSDFHFDDLED